MAKKIKKNAQSTSTQQPLVDEKGDVFTISDIVSGKKPKGRLRSIGIDEYFKRKKTKRKIKRAYNNKKDEVIKTKKNIPLINIPDGEVYGRGFTPIMRGNSVDVLSDEIIDPDIDDATYEDGHYAISYLKTLSKIYKSSELKEISDIISEKIDFDKKISDFVYSNYNSSNPEYVFDSVLKYNQKIKDGFDKSKAYNYALGKLEKVSQQNFSSDPKYVANTINNIINIVINRFPFDKRFDKYNKIKEEVSKIEPLELSNKKEPGGAAIGTSISLIKNILKSKDVYFIKSVLDELQILLQYR